MITTIVIWYIGTCFTFTYCGDTNNGWSSFWSVFMCLLCWPLILGETIRDDIKE